MDHPYGICKQNNFNPSPSASTGREITKGLLNTKNWKKYEAENNKVFWDLFATEANRNPAWR